MRALFCLLVVKLVSAHVSIDPTVLESVFGAPPVDAKDNGCQCVPHYQCDKRHVAVDENNVAVTGWGALDVRFGNDSRTCQRNVEVCCTSPKDPKDVSKAKPNPPKEGCGYRNPGGVGPTITKGDKLAEFGEFPWVVMLLDAQTGRHVGTGALIHAEVVITATHLVYKYPPGGLKVRAGDWDMGSEDEVFDHQERVVKEIRFYKEFNLRTLRKAIALLRLQSPFHLTEHINTVCLADVFQNFENGCVANGWGKTAFGRRGRYSNILKRVDMEVIPYDQCNLMLKRTRLGNDFRLAYNSICAGGEQDGDICQGDGGAPLACLAGDRYLLAGAAAWGVGCGQRDVPGVYASVEYLRYRIDETMEMWGYGNSSYVVK